MNEIWVCGNQVAECLGGAKRDFSEMSDKLTGDCLAPYGEVAGRTLWFFMCGRGTHEKVYGELKGGFAFDCLPTQRYHANSAWQVFSIIAFNLMRAMQAGTTERRSTNRKRRTIRPFQTIQTLRYGLINRAGLLVQPGGRQILDVGNNPMVQEHFKTVESALAA